ncbi:hypothetical protein ACF06N_10075 [Streptomyces albidoflavus]
MGDAQRACPQVVACYRFLDHGNHWYFEAVPDRDDLVIAKQAEVTESGHLLRYSWRHLEDGQGFLTDQPLGLAEDPVEAITAEAFGRVWAG